MKNIYIQPNRISTKNVIYESRQTEYVGGKVKGEGGREGRGKGAFEMLSEGREPVPNTECGRKTGRSDPGREQASPFLLSSSPGRVIAAFEPPSGRLRAAFEPPSNPGRLEQTGEAGHAISGRMF